jgi:hypothetical protein
VKAIRRGDEKKVQLGKASTSMPHKPYNLEGEIMIEKSETFVIREPGMLYFDDFKEIIIKLAPLVSSSNSSGSSGSSGNSNMSFSDTHWDLLSDFFGRTAHVQSSVDWYSRILQEENLVDTFAVSRPDAQGRCTCWNQSENRRYVNMGNRIDHILVSKSWWDESGVVGITLAGEDHENDKHRAALWACTAGGRFRPAPQEGTGLEEGSKEAYNEQFRPPHTGIVYFPPDYSDHVGVSIVIGILTQGSLVLSTDPVTRKTQPHSLQSTMTGFFTKKTDSTSSSSDPTPTIPVVLSSSIDASIGMSRSNETSLSSSVDSIKGKTYSLTVGSKKQELLIKPVSKPTGVSFFSSSHSSVSAPSLSSFEKHSASTEKLSSSSSVSINTSEEHSMSPSIPTPVSTMSSLPSSTASSVTLSSSSSSLSSKISVKGKSKGKNEPMKKKSKVSITGNNVFNGVKITSFFQK